MKKILYFLLIVFLLTDLVYSFKQHLSQPLDGDMAGGIMPASDVKPILNSPLGLDVITNETCYPNPNRFFSHWMFYKYFNEVPFFLQKHFEPIDSVYISCAIAKITIQISIIFLLAFFISKNLFKLDFLIAAVLITPLFQTNGYKHYMGIIDDSTTYTFFYALPCAILLLYLIPFVRQFHHRIEFPAKTLIKFLLIPLAFVVCLSGPLNPGIILIFSAVVLFVNFRNNLYLVNSKKTKKNMLNAIRTFPRDYFYYLIPVCFLALYSLYIAKYNSISIVNQHSLKELYFKLPEGIIYQFTNKMGFPILFIMLLFNSFLILKKAKTEEGRNIIAILKWIGIFSLIYILLLPLGGYRDYRPHVLRYDTIMPITLAIMFIYGLSTLYLIKNLSNKNRMWYIPLLLVITFVFTFADEAEFNKNTCEKMALKEISLSKNTIVPLHYDCNIISWVRINTPENSELNAEMLLHWNITTTKKLYYNK